MQNINTILAHTVDLETGRINSKIVVRRLDPVIHDNFVYIFFPCALHKFVVHSFTKSHFDL